MNRILPGLAIAATIVAAALATASSADARMLGHPYRGALAGAYGALPPGPGAFATGRRTNPRMQPRGSHWSLNNNFNNDFQLGGSY